VSEALTILLLRHGQTDANAAGIVQGHQPTPLNSLGRHQAAKLAARLAAWSPRVDVLVTSDLLRATQTADAIAAACGFPAVQDATWRERFAGDLEGKQVGHRGIWETVSATELANGEPFADFEARVRAALLALPARFPAARTLAVVTHGGPLNVILRMLDHSELQTVPNCAILQLRLRRESGGTPLVEIEKINDADHLDPCKISTLDRG